MLALPPGNRILVMMVPDTRCKDGLANPEIAEDFYNGRPGWEIGWAAHALSNAIVVAFSLIDLKNEWVARGARLKMDPEQDQNWREDEARFATQT